MATAVVTTVEVEDTGSGLRTTAGLLLALSAAFVGFGWWRLVNYDGSDLSSDKIVGGDAYNYQILALHGIGFVAIGIAVAVIACTCAVLGTRR